MCQCKTHNVNGTPGAYSWDGKTTGTYPPNPPELPDGHRLIFDEPGRCCDTNACHPIDLHSHHMRLSSSAHEYLISCEHGGGREAYELSKYFDMEGELSTMSSDMRYLTLYTIWKACREAAIGARLSEAARWRRAFVDKSIKKRTRHGRVYIDLIEGGVTHQY